MKTLLLIFSVFFFSWTGFSQEKDRGEIEALKIAFITDAIGLSPPEAQKFWPVYNKYEEQEDAIRSNMHCKVYDKMDRLESLSEAEAEALLQKYMNLHDAEQRLRKTYVSELKKVISAKEILMLKKAEYEFHKKLLKKYRSEKGEE